jgi:hypothetical protein
MSQVKLVTTVKEFREQYSRKQGQDDPEVCRLIYSGKELQDVNDFGEWGGPGVFSNDKLLKPGCFFGQGLP